MVERTVPVLKFVGTISLGLLTGFSYTLSTVTLPTLLTVPTPLIASKAFNKLSSLSLNHLRSLAGVSASSLLLAYLISPRAQKHPYLIWTSLFVGTSFIADLIPLKSSCCKIAAAAKLRDSGDSSAEANATRQMEASYEVLGSNQDGDFEEDTNIDETRAHMESFMSAQLIRTAITGIGFALNIVGIWGDCF